jgi:hypothetical protein
LRVQRWKLALISFALCAVLAAEASATAISERTGDDVAPAATDLAVASVWDARGVPAADGEVGTARSIPSVEPTLIPEPDTLLLVSLGMVGLTIAGRRRNAPAA